MRINESECRNDEKKGLLFPFDPSYTWLRSDMYPWWPAGIHQYAMGMVNI